MKKFLKKGVRLFFQGLLALLPIILTFYLVGWLITFVMGIAGNFLIFFPKDLRANPLVDLAVQVAVVITGISLLMLFGLFVRTIFGKSLLKLTDQIMGSIPVVKAFYKTIRQVIEMLALHKTTAAMRPVLAEYPSAGIWSIGFNTGLVTEELSPDCTQEHYTVLIPTTPNPTTGFLCVLPKSKIKPLPIPTEQAFKLILTGGAVKK